MPNELSESDCFVLLAHRRRRLTLRVLMEAPPPLTTAALAERIATREAERPSDESRRAVYLALYHNHLPRLEAADVVSCDTTEGTVYPGRNFDVLLDVLDDVSERDRPWADE